MGRSNDDVDAWPRNMQSVDRHRSARSPDELVCSLTMTLMPPGSEMDRFGLEVRIDWPAAVNPTCWAFPLVLASPLLQLALEFDFTAVAVTRPFKRFRSARVDCG
jgi:hypothetical protein